MNAHYGPGRPARNRKNRTPNLAIIIVLLLLLAGAGYYFFMHKKPAAAPVTSSPNLSYSQQQSVDVNTVGGAIGQYTQANGVTPTHLSANGNVLVMCNAACDPTTSQISQLAVYQAKNVQIKSYTPGQLVASVNDMYLVQGATCKSRAGIGDQSSNPKSMVILYATESSSGLSQHCVKL
jgi:hypothetical protein